MVATTFESLLAEYLLLELQAEGHVSRVEDSDVFVARCGSKEYVVELKVIDAGKVE